MVEIRLDSDAGIDDQDLYRVRQRFLSVNHDRLQRAYLVLSQHQQSVLRLLPLLLHLNHPLLPGYVSSRTPAGLSAYQPSADLVQYAQFFAPSFTYQASRANQAAQPLHGLFLMGSLGSVAYAEDSDMDFWLCHSAALTPTELQSLRKKCDLLQDWAASCGAKMSLFLIEPQQFARGQSSHRTLSIDDCGSTQHYLLLDEFYRTALWLAGRTLLWWLVPADEEHRYQDYCAILFAKRYVRDDEVIDLGGLAHIPSGEFISAGVWQLYKGIESPYKSLLKLLLLEVYATEQPQIECLSLSFKRAIYANQLNLDELDAYVMLYRRLEAYLLERHELGRLEVVRRCFYLKVGKRLTQGRLPGSSSWRRRLLEQLTDTWGWHLVLLSDLDRRPQWKVLQVQQERCVLVHELIYSYRCLTQLSQQRQAPQQVQPSRDLTVLWHRLYAAFAHTKGKIEYLDPGIAPDLSEPTLTFVRSTEYAFEQASWGVFRGRLDGQEWHAQTPLQRHQTLLSILVWAYLNGVIDDSTQLHCEASDSGLSVRELYAILSRLRRVLPLPLPAVTEDILLLRSYPVTVLLLVNLTGDPAPQCSPVYQNKISEPRAAFSGSGLTERTHLSIDQVVLNSWNELTVSQVSGEAAVQQSLTQLFNHCAEHNAELHVHMGCFSGAQPDLLVRRLEQLLAQAFTDSRVEAHRVSNKACTFYRVRRESLSV